MTHTASRVLYLSVLAAAVLMFPSGPAYAQFPVGPADDVLTPASIGQFIIWVDPNFRSLMIDPNTNSQTNCYDAGSHEFRSPVLVDYATRIGLSAPFQEKDAADSGTLVGSVAVIQATIGDSQIIVPSSGFSLDPNQREVHTKLTHLDLVDGLGDFHVRAGDDPSMPAHNHPLSPGEVQSKSTSGVSTSDFPARSFFDVFVEVDTRFGTLYNDMTHPLLVISTDVTSLPPTVIYTHSQTPAVPVRFKSGPNINKIFGYLRLAGHGTQSGCCDPNRPTGAAAGGVPPCAPPDCRGQALPGYTACPEGVAFVNAISKFPRMPCAQCTDESIPAVGTTGLVILLLLILAAGTIFVLRRRQGTTTA